MSTQKTTFISPYLAGMVILNVLEPGLSANVIAAEDAAEDATTEDEVPAGEQVEKEEEE